MLPPPPRVPPERAGCGRTLGRYIASAVIVGRQRRPMEERSQDAQVRGLAFEQGGVELLRPHGLGPAGEVPARAVPDVARARGGLGLGGGVRGGGALWCGREVGVWGEHGGAAAAAGCRGRGRTEESGIQDC